MTTARAVALLVAAAGLAACGKTAPPPPPSFAGSGACAGCHAAEHAAWAKSQHALAMQPASEATVLARFDDRPLTIDGTAARFFRRDGKYYVETAGPDGRNGDFELRYTFGVWPLQQYLVPLDRGRLQAFGLAWDARPAESGGQRWFTLYPGQSPGPGDPLHWTGIDQNWNYQCADCHSTGLRKNYDVASRTFRTTWSEISVGCEACHGPASNHLAWAKREGGWRGLAATKGLTVALDERRGVEWLAQPAGTARRSVPRAQSREIDTCARCHARRGQFADAVHAGDPWLDAFRPALLESPLYQPDGQQREEVYTWGSFLQSRMHAAGVTCADCHDPHTQKLRAPGNGVCTQCHAPAAFDAPAHHHHAAGSAGAQCVACHMPATTYMVVDPRHDHSLRIPRPDRAAALGTPDACTGCHAGRDPAWAAAAVAGWFPRPKPGFQGFAEAFAAADRREPAAVEPLVALAKDPAQPALVRASAVARLARFLSPAVVEALAPALADADPLLRAAAAEAVAGADPATRVERLVPLLGDPARAVRMAAARGLAGAPEGRLLGDERGRFEAALAEWTAAQQFNAERPEAQSNLGTLAWERGDADGAVARYREALALDPTFVQAAVNLADVERARGDEASGEAVLRDALARSPQPAAYHALGLSLIRQGRRAEALEALRQAQALAPDDARFAYVYAVALHDTGRPAVAVAVLRAAIARNPYDRSLLDALAAWEAEGN